MSYRTLYGRTVNTTAVPYTLLQYHPYYCPTVHNLPYSTYYCLTVHNTAVPYTLLPYHTHYCITVHITALRYTLMPYRKL